MTRPQITWISRDDPPEAFPAIDSALKSPNGLLAAGGDLAPARLLYAYARGIFPWFEDGQPILWWSPDPRCVLHPLEFHLSRRFRRTLQRSRFRISFNQAFEGVIAACGRERLGEPGTWITGDMEQAYSELHRLGWAHSVEVWLDEELVGGVYGLGIGQAFFGESMFSQRSNASKAALFALCRELAKQKVRILDCQVRSSHVLTLGARLMSRESFKTLLASTCATATKLEGWPQGLLEAPQLLQEN